MCSVHLILSYAFPHRARVLGDPNGLFIPAGWDSEALVANMIESNGRWTAQSSFTSIIPPVLDTPHQHTLSCDDIKAEDDKEFLIKMKRYSDMHALADAGHRKKTTAEKSGALTAITSGKETTMSGGGPTNIKNPADISNFFNSLLKRGDADKGVSAPGGDGRGLREKASAEMQKRSAK